MYKSFLILISICILLAGCTTTYQITPKQSFKLKDGRIVLSSTLEHSSIKIELASLIYKDSTPLVIAAYAKINTPCDDDSCIFSIENISVDSNGFSPSLIPARLILNSSLNFVDTLQSFSIPTPLFYSPRGPDLIYSPFFPFGGFFFISSRWDDSYFRESQFSRRLLFTHYLKPSNLDSKDFSGGFVAINLLGLDKKDRDLSIKVKIDSDVHSILLHFSPIK